MDKTKLAYSFMLIGLIGLMMSCSAVEQLDHDDPIKPLPKVIDAEMAERLRHTNSLYWNHGSRPINEIAIE